MSTDQPSQKQEQVNTTHNHYASTCPIKQEAVNMELKNRLLEEKILFLNEKITYLEQFILILRTDKRKRKR